MIVMIKRILDLAGNYKIKILLGILFNFLKSVCMAIMLLAVYIVADHLDDMTMTVIWNALIVLCISVLGRFLFQWLMDVSMSAKGFDIFRDYRLRVGLLMRKAPMGYFSEQRLGSIQNVLTTTVTELEQYSMMAVIDLTSGILMAFVMIIFFLISVPIFAFIKLGGLLIGILILHSIQKVANEHAPKVLAAQENMTTHVLEYIRGIAVLRTFSQTEDSESNVYDSFRQKKNADLAQEHASMALMKWYSAVYKLTGCILMLTAVLMYLKGTLSLSWCLMVIVSAFIIFAEMEQMGNGAFLSRVVTAGLNRLEEVTDIPQMDTTANELTLQRFDIELREVSFGYERSRKIIDHVSMYVPQGTTCAIVGPSGSGKTTLCNLIARFWDVQEGQVLVGGQDVKQFTADSLMQYISMVFQNVYLFNDTIEKNIQFGNPDASYEQIVEAAKKAQCHEFIMSLPEGYATRVGEGGCTLSGGEKQRISIARAILKDAPIIILDEATSSVDPENEAALQSAIDRLTHDKTIIIIAHRLKTVRNADQILVVDNAHIVQHGTHSELIQQKGLYADFVSARQKASGWKLFSRRSS